MVVIAPVTTFITRAQIGTHDLPVMQTVIATFGFGLKGFVPIIFVETTHKEQTIPKEWFGHS